MATKYKFTVTMAGKLIGKRVTESRNYTHAVVASKGKDGALEVVRWSSRRDLAMDYVGQVRKYRFNVSVVEVDQKTQAEAEVKSKARRASVASTSGKFNKAQLDALAWVHAAGRAPAYLRGDTRATVDAHTRYGGKDEGYRQLVIGDALREIQAHPFVCAAKLFLSHGFKVIFPNGAVKDGLQFQKIDTRAFVIVMRDGKAVAFIRGSNWTDRTTEVTDLDYDKAMYTANEFGAMAAQ